MWSGRYFPELIMRRLLPLFLLFIGVSSFAQSLEQFFKYLEEDKVVQVRKAIPELIRRYPRNPDVLYLSALVETDADKALLIYKDVLSQYPNSERADDALTKIIEYLYTKGLYNKTIAYSKQLIAKYPESENVGNCVYLMLCSFNVMNKKDSVDYYYSYYLSRYPNLDLPFSDYQVVSTHITGDKPVADVTRPAIPAVPEPKPSSERWALQLGAFGNPQNALALKNRLSTYGYQPYVQKIKGRRGDLLAIRVGDYESQEEASRAGERLRALHDIDFIVIKKNSWE